MDDISIFAIDEEFEPAFPDRGILLETCPLWIQNFVVILVIWTFFPLWLGHIVSNLLIPEEKICPLYWFLAWVTHKILRFLWRVE